MSRSLSTLSVLAAALLLGACQDYTINPREKPVGDDIGDTDGLPFEDSAVVPPETDIPDPTSDDPVPVASFPVYAHTTDELFEVDPLTGVATSIGQFTVGARVIIGMVDLAIDNAGRMYGGTQGDSDGDGRAVWRIDPTSGEVTLVCNTPVKMFALTFLSDGRLIAGDEGRLLALDLSDNCRVSTLATHPTWVTSGDVVALPDGLIYWTVRGERGDEDKLVVVDPDSGLYAEKGPIKAGGRKFDRLFGLGFDEAANALYGFSADGEIVRINPTNGEPVLLQDDSDVAWYGACTNPVLWQN